MDNMKCITFDKAAQDALPEEIKARMKADREKARKELLPKCDSCNWFNFSCNIGEPGESACPDYVERTLKEK